MSAQGSRTVKVRFTSEEKDLTRGTKQVENDFDHMSKSFDQFKTGVIIGSAAIVASLAVIGKQAIDAAGGLSAAVGTTQQIFGASADAIEAWAKTAADRLGQSNRQALIAANGFATFAKAAGLSQAQAVGFSIKLVELASDLAAFRDTTPEEAIIAISAALRGENDPIEKYGILLNDATVRQEALRLGIIKTTKEALTPQQRILAVNSLLFKQTADAQGQFARESDQLGTSQARLNAKWEDAKAALGEALLPYAIQAVNVLEDLAGWVKDNEEVAGVLIGTLGGLALAVLSVEGALKLYRAALVVSEAAQWAWNAAVGAGSISSAGLFGIGVAAILGGLLLINKGLKDSGKDWGDFWGWIVTAAKAAVNGVVWAINKIIDAINWLGQKSAEKLNWPGAPKFEGIPHIPEWRAKGGPVITGRPYVVGEVGPELFVPRQSGTIVPNDQIAAGGWPGGQDAVTAVQVDVYLDGRHLDAHTDARVVKSNQETVRRARAINPRMVTA